MNRYQHALQEILNVLGPRICECPQSPECGLADEAHEALRIAQEALEVPVLDDPDELLDAWYDWWRTNPDAPAKMPEGLHVRTAIHLKYRELIEEKDDA